MKNEAGVQGRQGMVASSQPLATEIGVNILRQGGSAVDAAIAVNATLGLVEPHMCGIGGDLFAIVWDAERQQLQGFNGSGRSAQGIELPQLAKRLADEGHAGIPAHGPLSLSVPGAVDGWFELHERYGRLPMAEILAPAIHHAETGFTVTPVIAEEWQRFSALHSDSAPGAFNETYLPAGQAPANGSVFKNPGLGTSYALLAREGREAFYRGELAVALHDFIDREGGLLGREDFAGHRSEWVDTLSVDYRGYAIHELPPNGQGLAALQMFAMLDRFDIAAMGGQSAKAIHYMVEAKKLAFEDRARFYADPRFSAAPVEQLLSSDYNAARAATISEQAALHVEAGLPPQSDTVYLATADAAGNMVSLIQSIYHPFGSGVVVPGTGFALQNRGMSFSLDPQHANCFAPGKRPFQTIIPAFVMRDDKPWLSFGVMGGDMQPQGHVQVLVNLIDRGMGLQEAGDAPRWRHDGSSQPTDSGHASLQDGGSLVVEESLPESICEELASRGHKITGEDPLGFGFGGYQAIMRDGDGVYTGASESRKDGCVLAY